MKNKFTIKNQNKAWWLSLASLIAVLVQQVFHLFGWEITGDEINTAMAIVNTVLVILGSLGLVTDTSKNTDTGGVITGQSTLNEIPTPKYSKSTNLRRN